MNTNYLTDEEIELLWDNFRDIPLDDLNGEDEDADEELVLGEPYFIWDEGTSLTDVWHWFDDYHSIGVGFLMNERNTNLYCEEITNMNELIIKAKESKKKSYLTICPYCGMRDKSSKELTERGLRTLEENEYVYARCHNCNNKPVTKHETEIFESI